MFYESHFPNILNRTLPTDGQLPLIVYNYIQKGCATETLLLNDANEVNENEMLNRISAKLELYLNHKYNQQQTLRQLLPAYQTIS